MDLRNPTQKQDVDRNLVELYVDGLVEYSCVYSTLESQSFKFQNWKHSVYIEVKKLKHVLL